MGGIKIPQNLQPALDLAKAGVAVLPCGPDKRPRLRDWQNQATTDEAQIQRLWKKSPDAMPGIPMGPRTGWAVLDVDFKNGKDGFAALEAMGLDIEILSPVQVETPTGGRHLYFRWHEGLGNSAKGLPPGLDVRGEGGYVIAPGATHEGGTYRLLKGTLTDPLPDWPKTLRPHQKAASDWPSEPTGLPFHVILSALMALPNDGDAFASRDDWLRVGMALHAEAHGSEEGRETWHDWSRQWPGYDKGATDSAWDSFRSDGGVTGWHIIREAQVRGWSDPALSELRRIEAADDFTDDMVVELDAEALALIYGPPEDAPPAASGLTFLTPAECALRPARPYVVKGLIAQRDVVAIVGPPGVGKSLLAPRLAYAIAQGAEVFGRRTKVGGVLYVAAEDGQGMGARLHALRQDYGEADKLLLTSDVSDLLSKGGHFKALRAEVQARRPSLVIIDTLAAAFPGLKENDPDGMGQVVAAARSLTTWGAAVILIHHDTKAGDGLPRGHSILNGALDMSLALSRDGGMVTAKPSKNRNGTTEIALAFTIRSRALGEDEDGDPITAAIAEEADGVRIVHHDKGLSPSARAALDVFRSLSQGTRPVSDGDWRKAVIGGRAVSAADDPDSRRKAFKRAVEELTRKGKVTFDGDQFHEPNRRGEDFRDDFDHVG